jgi:genome maintenance exonuclease 1
VTTILDATSDKTHLIAWRNRIGEAQANQISKESAGLGTLVHTTVEKYILGENWDNFGSNHVQQMAKNIATNIINQGLSRVQEVWGSEVGLLAPGLYAGTADGIGIFDHEPSIFDFKTAKKIKKKEWIEDYFIQGVFYAEAHNSMFNTDIQQVVIMMGDREGNYTNFIINGNEYEHYRIKAMTRLAKYYGISL